MFLLAAIYFGSGRLAHFDPVLAGYCAAVVVAFFETTRRVSLFWRRPPSALFGRTLAAALLQPRTLLETARNAARDLGAQRFIARRSRLRGLAHLLLSWGTVLGFAVTLPLVFGWLHFEGGAGRVYEAFLFGVALATFDVDGASGWLVFHALHLSAVAVVLGASYFLALRLRRRGEDAAGGFHVAPLAILLAVAVTGLALPLAAAVPAWFRAAQIAHEAAVIVLLLALPYGKLLHVFIRPLHLGAQLVRQGTERAACVSCGAAFAPAAQLEAIHGMLVSRGFRFGDHPHLCPGCRRRRLSSAHAHLFDLGFQPRPAAARGKAA